jgi:DegV family protein with EDD domain
MEFLLTTDTSCDIFRHELDEAGVPWIPLTYTINGETFEDTCSSSEDFKAFYKKMQGGAMPTTSQITPMAHTEFFEPLILKGHKKIIHLALSGGLSSTVEAARLSAGELMEKYEGTEIYILDTLAATQGNNMLFIHARRLQEAGKTAKEAFDILTDKVSKLHHFFMVNDLHHLKRGGRISAASAAIGSLLKIKPVLVIDDIGKLTVIKKALGPKKAIDFILEMVKKHTTSETDNEYIVVHANVPERADEVKARLEKEVAGSKVSVGWIGPIIGAHTGEGLLGVILIGDKRLPHKE